MPDLLTRTAAGAAAGFAATGPMTLVLAAARAALPAPDQYSLPPRIVTERAAQDVGVADRMTEPEKKAATTAAHFGFGTAAGAAFGALARHLPFDPVANGVAYGLAVWAGSYLGWLPAVGLHPPPHQESAGRTAMNIGAHVAWGAVLGLLTDQLAGEADPREARPVNRVRAEVLVSG